MQTTSRYSSLAVILHWIVAAGILVNVALAWSFNFISDDNIRFAIDTHKSLGISVLGFVLLRIFWRLYRQPPAFPYPQPPLERFLANATHLFLYSLMLLLPISGWLHDSAWKAASDHPMHLFGLFEWPRIGAIMQLEPVQKEHWHEVLGLIHTSLSYALYGLLLLHVAAALKHHFSVSQPVRGRGMLPG
ncbi:cytochrome b [Permianibacter sp. IMCC34836]|uniref:cytochrome b n=1 Tax=Permianibacter fluminis TaxID=2738515 RepID=UPI001551D78F|nr:cytochrome b/b6 domain-containing protein [Permianibacter fluminis]NQD35973.1 cytochrome b [Permianibacter fluminis]